MCSSNSCPCLFRHKYYYSRHCVIISLVEESNWANIKIIHYAIIIFMIRSRAPRRSVAHPPELFSQIWICGDLVCSTWQVVWDVAGYASD